MKAIINIALFVLITLSFAACTKEDVPVEGNVTFVFEHVVNEKGVVANSPLDYINAAGNPFSISSLKYIITRVVLIDQSGNEVPLNNYDIIDAFGSSQLDPITLPNGTYQSMKFTVGVDTPHNVSNTAIGDLVPGSDMHFSSADGYIFLKHEGKFLDGNNDQQDLIYHYGKPGNHVDIEIPVGGLKVNGAAKTAYVTFNLNAIYESPNVDFKDGGKRYSGVDDAGWIGNIKANLPSAFSFSGSYEL